MRNKKKYALLLLVPTIMPVLFSLLFQLSTAFIQAQMEEPIEKDALIDLIVYAEELQWRRKGKEIILNGHLFDVISVKEVQKGIFKLTGKYDSMEQELDTRFGEMQKKENPTNNGTFIIQMLSITAILTTSEPSSDNSFLIRHNYNEYSLGAVADIAYPLITPPPQS